MASPSGILRYPYEAITDTTDYLQITIKKNKRLGDGDKEKYIQNAAYAYSSNPASVSGISASFLKPQVLAENGVILLPMPSNIQDSNSVSYDNDSMNAISGFAAGEVLELIKNPSGFGDTLGSVMGDSSSEAGRKTGIFANNQLKDLALRSIAAQAVNVFGANVSLNSLLARSEGKILNPNMELLFNNVTLRTFRFSFKMTPRDENEATSIKSIIRTLKRNVAAKNKGKIFLETPNIFELQYKKGNRPHPFLNLFQPCALSDMSVNYTGENVYATYADGTPISMIMTLSFKELFPIYQEDYETGAFFDGEAQGFDDDDLIYGITGKTQKDNVQGVGL